MAVLKAHGFKNKYVLIGSGAERNLKRLDTVAGAGGAVPWF